ncbi:MAG: MFS transporter [Acidimicrobiales bacterium]
MTSSVDPIAAVTSIGGRAEPTHAIQLPNFRLLWINSTAFMVLMNAQRFVIAWFVLDGLDRSEADQGLVVFALGVPTIFLTMHAGVWADRWQRKRLLFGSQVAMLGSMAGLFVLAALDEANFAWVLVMSVLAGSAMAVGGPVRQSLVPAIIPRELIFSAVGLTAIGATVSMMLGPVLARGAGSIAGFEGAFGFLVLLVVIGLTVLVPLQVPEHESVAEARPVRTDLAEIMRWVRDNPPFRKLVGLLTFAGMTIMPLSMVLMQAHVKEAFGRDSGDAAYALATMGFGVAVMSFYIMRKGSLPNKGGWFMCAMMLGGTVVALMGLTTALWQLVILGFFMGLGGGVYMNMSQGLFQTHTPQELMGRMMALFALTMGGVMPVCALIYGFVAERVGTGPTTVVGGLACLVVALVAFCTDRSGLKTLS